MIYADFGNADRAGRVRLNLRGSVDDIRKQGIELRDGLELKISDGELSAHGVARFSDEEQVWVVEINWTEVQEP